MSTAYVSRVFLTGALTLSLAATSALAWPFASTNPAQTGAYTGASGFNYTVRLGGSLWTVDTDNDGTIDGYFTIGDAATATAGWGWATGPAPMATTSAFDINALAGDPLPTEDPDVPEAEPMWANAHAPADTAWALELAQGAGKDALAALYADSTGAFVGVTLNAGSPTDIDWTLARWPDVASAGGATVASPLAGSDASTALTLTESMSGQRLDLVGTLNDLDGAWAIDEDTGAAGNETSFALAQAAAYLRGTFYVGGASFTIVDPTDGMGNWNIQEWTGLAYLHPGPVSTVCPGTGVCDFEAPQAALDAAGDGHLIDIGAGTYTTNPTPTAGVHVANKSRVTVLGSGNDCTETIISAVGSNHGLELDGTSSRVIVENITVREAERYQFLAIGSDRGEFNRVCAIGKGQTTATTESFNGPYGIGIFEATNTQILDSLAEDNYTAGVANFRSTGVYATDLTSRNNGGDVGWPCLYLNTANATDVGDADMTLRGTTTLSGCPFGINVEDVILPAQPIPTISLNLNGTVNITGMDNLFFRAGLATVDPSTETLANQLNSCASLQQVNLGIGPVGENYFTTYTAAAAASAQLAAFGAPHVGPVLDTDCLDIDYPSTYSIALNGSIWTVDTDADGDGSDGFFVVGDRLGATGSWGPALTERGIDLPTASGDPRPAQEPDAPELDAGWGTTVGDGSAYGLDFAVGAGKDALGAVYGGLTDPESVPAVPLNTAQPTTPEWAVAQWPYVSGTGARAAIPLSGTATSFTPQFTNPGAVVESGSTLSIVAQFDEGDGNWNVDSLVGIPGDEEVVALSSSAFYFRGNYAYTGNFVDIPNPVDGTGPDWRLREYAGPSQLNLGSTVEVCADPADMSWPRLNCDFSTVQAAIDATPDGGTVVLSPGTHTASTGTAVGRIDGRDRLTITGHSDGCTATEIDAELKTYGIYVTNSTRIVVENLTARNAALHHVGASFCDSVEFSQACGHGGGQTASNGQSFPGPTGLNFNLVTNGLMADVRSTDNSSNGIAVLASPGTTLRNLTVEDSGESQGWAGLALYTTPGPNVAGGDSSVRLEGTNHFDNVPMGIFVEDGFDTDNGVPYELNFQHVGTTTFGVTTTAPLFRGGLGTVTPDIEETAETMDLCWKVGEPLPAPPSAGFYDSRPAALGAQQGAIALGLGNPDVVYNVNCDCNGVGEVCEDGNPCVEQTCGMGDGQCTYASRMLGDVTTAGASGVGVSDALCAIIVVLDSFNPPGGPAPACLDVSEDDVDVNCDGTLDISDALLIIARAVNIPFDSGVDSDGNLCPDTCETYFP